MDKSFWIHESTVVNDAEAEHHIHLDYKYNQITITNDYS